MVADYSQRLIEAMKDAKLDVTALSKGMGISYQAVRKAVGGGKFGTDSNIKAARLLGVSSDWLATGKGEKRPAGGETQPPPVPSDRFDNLSADEQRFLHNLRELQVDEDQYQELMELVATKAAKMRALKERMLAGIVKTSGEAIHSADARKTDIARAALEITDNLKQRSLFVDGGSRKK
jgi:hypothetical protein